METLVIKYWHAKDRPDIDGNYIQIVGRSGGIVAWLLAFLGIIPTTTTRIKVGLKRVEFTTSSLAGTTNRMIPLESVSSSYYGYHKPWGAALSIFIVPILATFVQAAQEGWGGLAFSSLFIVAGSSSFLALIYFFLNGKLTLGFVEVSGVTSGIKFKRSVVEGLDINNEQARYICTMTQYLIEFKESGKQNLDVPKRTWV